MQSCVLSICEKEIAKEKVRFPKKGKSKGGKELYEEIKIKFRYYWRMEIITRKYFAKTSIK